MGGRSGTPTGSGPALRNADSPATPPKKNSQAKRRPENSESPPEKDGSSGSRAPNTPCPVDTPSPQRTLWHEQQRWQHSTMPGTELFVEAPASGMTPVPMPTGATPTLGVAASPITGTAGLGVATPCGLVRWSPSPVQGVSIHGMTITPGQHHRHVASSPFFCSTGATPLSMESAAGNVAAMHQWQVSGSPGMLPFGRPAPHIVTPGPQPPPLPRDNLGYGNTAPRQYGGTHGLTPGPRHYYAEFVGEAERLPQPDFSAFG